MFDAAVPVATQAAATSPWIVAGTAVLFLGAAIAMLAPREPFKGAEWTSCLQRAASIAVYTGALLAYVGVLLELGSSLRLIEGITAGGVVLALIALLVAAGVLRRRARRKQAGVHKTPKRHPKDKRPARGQ
jgi:predicted lysophospholipase L1 biosynthesis ABC-type transport system permease subunit